MPSVAQRYTSEHGTSRSGGGAAGRAPVVLMVSGGADSTALLVLAATSQLDIRDGRGRARIARERLHVLHVNHQLRGLDAEEDEEFVRELAQRYGIPCTVRRVDVSQVAARTDGNVENAGRAVRYAAAVDLANELSAQLGTPRSAARILTAHTANDRAETFFMNAIRGTGPAGLSSIPRQRNRIVRPLLDYTHEQLCELLRMRGIVWREDSTNADTHYLRAFVRHEVLPVVERRNPHVMSSLSTTCDILSDEDAYLTQVASRSFRDLERRQSDSMVALDARRLAATEVAIARRVVRMACLAVCPAARLEAHHIASVLEVVAAGTGSVTLPMGVDARVAFGLLFVRAQDQGEEPVSGWLPVPGKLDLGDGREISARLVPVPAGGDPVAMARAHGREWEGASVYLDSRAAGIDGSGIRLWVEPPQAGDVVCPLGMHGQSKKLSDLLADAKVPAADRPAIPVVHASPTGPILWVGGIRADERCRCTPATKLLLELSVHETRGTGLPRQA